ncbi:MAG: DUF1080 domain-containing protein [Fimbriiglobus sp.]|jgi:hypothetical protein|nr:DUF1080 domain-containing protein [Fimbriiglobus sp.]
MSLRRKLFTVAAAAVVVGGVGVLLAQREYKSGVVWPEPPVVTPAPVDKPGAPPSDAIVLFDGTAESLAKNFKNGEKWIVADGAATVKGGSIETKAKFGDIQLHLEFATPEKVDPKQTGQGRGNSGVYLMNRYEVQILDSYENKTYFDGQCGAMYKQQPPMVNVCRKPGEWQTYDILFESARFDADGKVTKPAVVTVLHNGVCVQNHFELKGGTFYDRPAKYEKHEPTAPFHLQDHGNPMRFRNIWVRELKPIVGKEPEKKPGEEKKSGD